MNINIKEYENKINAAIDEPYLIDRLTRLDDLKTDIAHKLKVHEKNQGYTSSEGFKMFGKGMAVTAVVVTAAAFALGAAPAVMVGALGFFGSMVTGIFYEEADSVKKRVAKNYREQHKEELDTLNAVGKSIDFQMKQQIDRFREMPVAEKAGVFKLEDAAEKFPALRDVLVQTFRASVENPVHEHFSKPPQAGRGTELEVNGPAP